MLNKLLALLLALFSFPVVADGDPDPDPDPANAGTTDADPDADADPDPDADPDDDDPTLEALLDRSATPVPEGAADKDGKVVRPSERRENELLRESIETSRETRRLLESRLPPSSPAQDPQEANDLEIIRQARESGDAAQIRGAEWAYNTNKVNRDNAQKANLAVFLAQETADKADFRELATTDPKLYKRFKEKVETKLAELRRGGQSVPRVTLYHYMVGKEISEARANGRMKTVKTKAGSDGVQRADRGRTPGARSDVSGRGSGGASKKEQLEKRLSGVRI